MPRQIFKNRIIAAAGPLPGQLTVDNLKRWTSLRKGIFTETFDENATHILCTEEQFRKRVPLIRQALGYGKKLHIVHYEWFEFSTVGEKRQPEREYSMRNVLARERAVQLEKKRIEKGKRDAERFGVNTCLFHIYQDREFFRYEIDITRDDEEFGEPGQKFTLYLWESNAKPHLYWFTARFLKRKGVSQPNYYSPSPCAGKWRHEIDLLMSFFRKKTNIAWEDRVILQGTTPPCAFQYTPPTRGKPVGRRLRHSYDYCLEINAQLRGLPWPPVSGQEIGEEVVEEAVVYNEGPYREEEDGSDDAGDDSSEKKECGSGCGGEVLGKEENAAEDLEESPENQGSPAVDKEDAMAVDGGDGLSDEAAPDHMPPDEDIMSETDSSGDTQMANSTPASSPDHLTDDTSAAEEDCAEQEADI